VTAQEATVVRLTQADSQPRLDPAVPSVPELLRVANLRVAYGRRKVWWPTRRVRDDRSSGLEAVRDVSLTVDESKIVALIGDSGSGKTSLALAVAQLIPITSGAVFLLGQDMSRLSKRELRKSRSTIQMIFQDPHGSFDPRQRMESAFRELRRVHGPRATALSDDALLERVGLTGATLKRLPSELSGGQVQRMAVARALLARPRLLIADEPTSALDVSVQAQMLDLLVSLKREEGLGILLITHNLAVARQVADFVHVMYRGAIVESGGTEAVLANPTHEYTRTLVAGIPGLSIAPDILSRQPDPAL
jgi:ABC-type glutathione transport system ATPase component